MTVEVIVNPVCRSGLIVVSVLTCGLVSPSLGRFVAWAVCEFCSWFARDDVFQFQNLFRGLAVASLLIATPFVGWFLGHHIADRWFGPAITSELRPVRIVSMRAVLIHQPIVFMVHFTKYFAQPGDLYLVVNCLFDTAQFRKCQLINQRIIGETLEFDFVALSRTTWLPKIFRMGRAELFQPRFQIEHPEIRQISVFDGSGNRMNTNIERTRHEPLAC